MLKLKRKPKVNGCEQYKLDLTDYATGDMTFLTKKKQQKLFEHLRKCSECRDKFFDYENIYGLLVTTAHVQKPEFIDRMDRLKEQFKMALVTRLPGRPGVMPEIKPLPGEDFSNHEEDIGQVAGVLWHFLGKNGRVKESGLEHKVGMSFKTFNRAIGWLSCQSKIHRTRVKKTSFVYLTQPERQIYQQEQAQAQV